MRNQNLIDAVFHLVASYSNADSKDFQTFYTNDQVKRYSTTLGKTTRTAIDTDEEAIFRFWMNIFFAPDFDYGQFQAGAREFC